MPAGRCTHSNFKFEFDPHTLKFQISVNGCIFYFHIFCFNRLFSEVDDGQQDNWHLLDEVLEVYRNRIHTTSTSIFWGRYVCRRNDVLYVAGVPLENRWSVIGAEVHFYDYDETPSAHVLSAMEYFGRNEENWIGASVHQSWILNNLNLHVSTIVSLYESSFWYVFYNKKHVQKILPRYL